MVSEVNVATVESAESAASVGAGTTMTDHPDASGTETCSTRDLDGKAENAGIGIVAIATGEKTGESAREAPRLLRASGSLRPT